MSKLAKEIATTGVATFVIALILFGLAQVIGATFSAVPTPVQVVQDITGEGEAEPVKAAATTEEVGETAEAATTEAAAEETKVAQNETATDALGEAVETASVTKAPAKQPETAEAGQGDAVPTGGTFALGRLATAEEVAAWDIDVRPDGMGLPVGSGDVFTGEEIFAEQCAVCHGDFGEAVGRWPVLAGGFDTLTADRPVKTIGSYWPYLSTVFDYVNRAMPFGNAQSLSPDEVYAITAYLLYVNDLVDDEFELSHANFADVKLPNQDNFFMDDRADTEYTKFVSADVCMSECKETVEITGRAAVVDVTPEETKARKLREAVNTVRDTGKSVGATAEAAEVEIAAAVTEEAAVATQEAATEEPVAAVVGDPELIKAGEKAFKKCKACHMIGEGAKKKSGPILTDVVGRPIGGADGFKYSKAMAAAGEEGRVWSEAELRGFLADPKKYMKGTKMSFKGLKEKDLDGMIAYLAANGG